MWIVGLLGLVVSLGFLRGDSARYTYSGTEVFRTESEYTAFKEAVAHPEVSIKEVQTLSSAPPILVDFVMEILKGLDFQYGERSGLPTGDGLFGNVFITGLILFLAPLLVGLACVINSKVEG